MMKFLLILVPGLLVFVISIIKSEYRLRLTGVFAIYVILTNTVYNQKNADRFVTFIKPANQMIYQNSYLETHEYADAFLQMIIKNKNIYTKNDPFTIEDTDEAGYYWLYAYYHMKSPVLYCEHYGANVISDEAFNNSVIDGGHFEDFTDIGYANDMLRNSFLYYPGNDPVVSTYFPHYWYYSEYVDGIHVYVNPNGIYDTDEIVLLWQNDEAGSMNENLYFMTKEYYDRNIKSDI